MKSLKIKKKIINVIDYEVFKNAVNKAVESFVNPEEYKLFLEDKQPEIKTTGKIIEEYMFHLIKLQKRIIYFRR